MKYFVFLDQLDFMPIIDGFAKSGQEMVIIKIGGRDECFHSTLLEGEVMEWRQIDREKIKQIDITPNDKVILSFTDTRELVAVIKALSGVTPPPPILVLADETFHLSPGYWRYPNVAVLNIQELALARISREWKLIEARQKASQLKELLTKGEKILIMTQHDPDPDAIASGLAVQALLGRNRTTAPICTFGAVKRNENIAMVRLLKTAVKTISRNDIAEYDKIVMVDVQPPYFGEGVFPNVDAVIDHHPHRGDEYNALFRDVNPVYGSTSTMLYEYLEAAGVKITRRLATALLYGIVSDTKYLERDATRRDFEAFSSLWPVSNPDLLASMSRPRLDPQELSYFVRAIKNRRVAGDLIFIWVGSIKKEDIIPRLADFSLQIGETSFSATCGVFGKDIVISVRSADMEKDAGEIVRSLFSQWGSAGGHRSMSKAVFPLLSVKKAFGLRTLAEVREKLFRMFDERVG